MLELRNLKKSYDGTVVLKDITLDIEDGMRKDNASESDPGDC